MNNYSSLTCVFSALNSRPIHFLKKAWGKLSDKSEEIIDRLREMFSSTRFYF